MKPCTLKYLIIYLTSLYTTLLFQTNDAANILFFHSVCSKSHLIVTWPLAKVLDSKGHTVSYITVCEPPENDSRISVLIPQHGKQTFESIIQHSYNIIARNYMKYVPPYFANPIVKGLMAEAIFSSEEFQTWIKSDPKIDLVIVDIVAEFGVALMNKLDCKVVVFSPLANLMDLLENTGVPEQVMSTFEHPFYTRESTSFVNRFKYVIGSFISSIVYQFEMLWVAWTSKKYLELEYTPPLHEQLRNVSLVFHNAFPFEDHKKAFPPNYIRIGGIHLKEKNNPLSTEINEFLGKSPSFIYISLGTLVNLESLPESSLEAFMETIRSFPEVKFLWMWNVSRPKRIPPNLYLAKWFPQQDILSDSRIKGFITQAGRPSLQESLYHGVPMITFPIIVDQDYNALMLEELGVSINLEILSVSPQQLISSISLLISSNELKSNALRVSSIIRDVPMKPLDVAVWWTEYVLRHESTVHLQSTGIGETSLFKKNFDVWLFVFVLLGTFSTASCYLTLRLARLFFSMRITARKSHAKRD